jgi:uncharacterized protein YbjT (DUF2867 family)
MKIVVIGGTGLIGSRTVTKLREHGHEAFAASPNTGVNSITGEGLADALNGASAVIDVSNSPAWDDDAVMKFFDTSTRNLLAAEKAAGVKHHVALSIVGAERMTDSGYFRAKIAQENLIKASAIPFTIVRATQFFEFVNAIAGYSTEGNTVRLPHVFFQPLAADDVAIAMSDAALGQPSNEAIDVAGPERGYLDEVVRKSLAASKDPRQVIADPNGRYYGIAIKERTLVPDDGAKLGRTRFEDWLSSPAAKTAAAAH